MSLEAATTAVPTAMSRATPTPGANSWTVATVVLTALAILPVATVVYIGFTPADDIWAHLLSTVLSLYITTTLQLMALVGLGTLIIGVGSAWLVAMCRFPGRRIFEWALLLPMAMPAYVIAYVYTDVLEFAGPLQGLLRELFGWSSGRDYWFPEIRSLGGAAAMMTLVLYPYVYLLSRAAFMEQSVSVLDASRVLGRGPWRSFFAVALPLARPAIVIGVSLVMMETLNDFGTVDYFAVSTFTLGIYDVWLNMSNVSGAAQLATVLLVFVVLLVTAERFARRKQRFHHSTQTYQPLPGYQLKGSAAVLASLGCGLAVMLGFLLPAGVLASYAALHFEAAATPEVFRYAANSVILAALAAVLAVVIGVFMAYGSRLKNSRYLGVMVRLASMGYAVPGSVLAVGILVLLGAFDNGVDGFMSENFGLSTGLLLSGTIAALTYGYLVRFLAISFGGVEASLAKVTPNMDAAARSLGHGAFSTLRRIHLPLIRGSLLAAVMLVFVDCMKELPLTVILRPFNFQTLATFVHQYASDEQLGEASVAALSIVGFGVLPVIVLSLALTGSRPGQDRGRNTEEQKR